MVLIVFVLGDIMKKLVAIIAILALLMLVGCTKKEASPAISAPAQEAVKTVEVAEPADAEEAETAPEPAATQIREITMTAKKWEFEPSTIEVNKGDRVVLTITSEDVKHGFAIDDFGVAVTLEPGKTVTTEFVADKAGTYDFYCSVYCGSGHRDMVGKLVVKE